MNSRVIGILIVLLVAILAIVISRNQSSPLPVSSTTSLLVAEPAEIHIYGSTAASNVQNHTVMVLNKSTQSITLEKVQSTCGCTTPQFDGPVHLRAGDSISLDIRTQVPATGSQKSLVSVEAIADDGSTVELEITILMSGSSQPFDFVYAAPSLIEIVGDEHGEDVTKAVSVTVIEPNANPWFIGFQSESEFIHVDTPVTLKTDVVSGDVVRRTYQVSVTATIPDDNRLVDGLLLWKTQRSEASTGPVVVRVSHQPIIRAVPEKAVFAIHGTDDSQKELRVILVSTDGEEFSISLADPLPREMRAKAITTSNPGTAVVELQLIDSLRATARSFDLLVETTHPLCRNVRIPIIIRKESAVSH